MIKIFLSYRRSDLDITSRLYTWLVDHGIPEKDIYFDKESKVNPYGREFPTNITNAVTEAKLMIAVIGPKWTTVRLPGRFKTRIKEENDWVRHEIALAMATRIDTQKEILPVLIDNRPTPTTKDLPPELHPLCSIHMPPLYRDPQYFELGMHEIAQVIERTFPGRYPGLWHDVGISPVFKVPDSNLLFTGRDGFLEDLHKRFNKGDSLTRTNVPLAICGLGGMGKTQTAIEYAHRFRAKYKTVLWAKADTPEKLRSDFIDFAEYLDLPEKDNKQNPQRVVDAVKDWLRDHSGWLLIFDNAEEPEVVQDFLPLPNRGHTLLTTRATSFERIAYPVEIPPMAGDEGVLFLLRRAGIPELTVVDQMYAREIVRELGGLSLAIEQAGAYIAETPSSLSEYLEVYKTHRTELLSQGKLPDYPYSVATTWHLFSKGDDANRRAIEDTHPAAIELLRLCAFLDPDAIPEEIVTGGTQALGPVLGPISSDQYMMNEIFKALSRFSLIRRSFTTKTLTIHRLVQAVIQDDMNEESQRMWAERAIRTVNHAFPDKVTKVETWDQCQRYLPHALACTALIKKHGLASPEAARLLNQAGTYLREQARFKDAEPLLLQALAIREQLSGPDHLDTAQSLDGLARFYFDQYMYSKAEPLYKRALAIREQIRGAEHPDVVRSLNRLGLTYWYMGNKSKEGKEHLYEEADRLYQRALPISEKLLGPEEPTVTLHIRNNQALLYRSQGKYEDAITINQQVLAIRKRVLDPEHLDIAQSLQNLAVTYYEQRDASKFEEAEELLREALAIREKKLPEKHVQIARCLRYLALIYGVQGKDEEADKCFKQALAIWEELLEVERSQVIEVREEHDALLRKMKHDQKLAHERARSSWSWILLRVRDVAKVFMR